MASSKNAAGRLCVTCDETKGEEVEGRYKCPVCYQYTCSLPCTKAHRDSHTEEEEQTLLGKRKRGDEDGATTSQGEQQSGVDADEFGGDDPELAELFRKYPTLREQLRQIADATDPPSTESALGDKKKANEKRHRTGPPGQAWTHEIGEQNGVHMLRTIRRESEGLREYCELVLIQRVRRMNQGIQIDQKRLLKRDAAVVYGLLREEGTK